MSYVIEWHGISQKFYVQTEPTQTVCLRIVYAELHEKDTDIKPIWSNTKYLLLFCIRYNAVANYLCFAAK